MSRANSASQRGIAGPAPVTYALFYSVKIALVAGLLVAGRRIWGDFRPGPRWGGLALAVGIGVLVTIGWVGLERLPYPRVPLSARLHSCR